MIGDWYTQIQILNVTQIDICKNKKCRRKTQSHIDKHQTKTNEYLLTSINFKSNKESEQTSTIGYEINRKK